MAKQVIKKKVKPKSTVVKMTWDLRAYVIKHAQWNESIDSTLRRLLGKPFQNWLKTQNGS